MKIDKRTRRIDLLLFSLLVLVPYSECYPHRDDFIDETIVYLTLSQQELELEYWFDYGSLNMTNFLRHNFASEFGITNHWMIDGRITYYSPDIKGFEFQSGRFETRYRFFDEGTLPIDIALSAEVNTEKDFTGERDEGIEGRLILSHDFADKLNLTLNIPEEFTFETHRGVFYPAFGFRYDANDILRFGTELKYNTFEHSGAVIPQVWITFGESLTLKLGYSKGLNKNNEDYGRIAFEAEI